MLKKIAIAFSVLLIICIAALLAISLVYEDQVKKAIVGQINKQLKAPVQVGEIEFSLFSNFPNASLSFYNISAKSVYLGKDVKQCPSQLFAAEKITLQFNLLDVFNKNYSIKQLDLTGVDLNLFTDTENLDNYHVWISDTTSSSSNVGFKMKAISAKQINFKYVDDASKVKMALQLFKTKMKGEVNQSDFAFLFNSELNVDSLSIDKIDYLQNKKTSVNGSVYSKDGNLYIAQTALEIAKLNVQFDGVIKKDETIDFKLKGKDLDIQSFLSLLPETYQNKLENYKSSGQFESNLHIFGNQSMPQIKADFTIVNGKIIEKKSKTELEQLQIKGSFSNGSKKSNSTSTLQLHNFSSIIHNNPISGKLSITNFDNPFVEANLIAKLDLNDIKKLLQLDTLSVLTGKAELDLKIAAPLSQLQNGELPISKKGQISGFLKVENMRFQFIHDKLDYNQLNADLYADDNYILVKKLQFNHGKSNVDIEGEISNFQSLFARNEQNAVLRAYFNSSHFELEDWLPQSNSNKVQKSNSEATYLNRIDLKLKAKIDQFSFDKFEAKSLSSTIYFKNSSFRFDSLRFLTMQGKAQGKGNIDIKADGAFDLYLNAQLSRINITQLFSQLNNFGQQTLTDKNIAGKLSADVVYKSSWTNLSQIKPNSIVSDANIVIEEGELNNFEPLNKLSRFISVSELQRIKFNKLENNISIVNEKIIIPQFEIKSSALNLFCSGTHTFENQVDYHFKITLNELLSKKRKREAPVKSEFDEIEEDAQGKTTLFISMIGPIDNPKIKFDKKELKKYVKDEIANEKKTVKQLLKDEFGLYKKDKSLKEKEAPKTKGSKQFDVEWDENDKPQESKTKTNNKAKEPEKVEQKKKSKEKQKKQTEENSDDYL